VTHRRAGKTVACIHDLQRAASTCLRMRPRFAYLSPFLKQSKAVAWDYLRAAMAPLRAVGASAHETELRVDYINGGQVFFIGTPKGRNAFFELWQRSQSEQDWFSFMLKASETGLIPESELALAKRDLSEDQYAQEFECSFDAAIVGSYYGK